MKPNKAWPLAVAIAVVLFVSGASLARDFTDRDTKEIGSYVLTEAVLAKYTQATKNPGTLARRMSDDCSDDDDSENAQSLDASVARFDAIPGVKAAIKAAGMTTREYIVFSWSVFQNGLAADDGQGRNHQAGQRRLHGVHQVRLRARQHDHQSHRPQDRWVQQPELRGRAHPECGSSAKEHDRFLQRNGHTPADRDQHRKPRPPQKYWRTRARG